MKNRICFSRIKLFALTHCILVDTSSVICWMSPFVILGVSGLLCHFYSIFDGKSCEQTNVGSDQMPHYVASDLGLHCFPKTLLRVSMKEWVKNRPYFGRAMLAREANRKSQKMSPFQKMVVKYGGYTQCLKTLSSGSSFSITMVFAVYSTMIL